MGTLEGKVAVVTGSGRGIGKETARIFAHEGAKVVINDVEKEVAAGTVRGIEEEGGTAISCIADIRSLEEAQKLMNTAVDEFGRLDILVNNAGLARDTLAGRMSPEQWQLVIDINLTGAFNCIRAASKYMMKKNHNGRVINVSSVVGLAGNMGQINYAAAKAGLIGLTKEVAKEWLKYGITCNAVAYGAVDTRLTQEKEQAEEVMGEKVGISKEVRDAVSKQIGKWMTPEEAAKPILFLASEDATYITGHVLNVTAGWYM